MNVALNSDLETIIKQKVRSGKYNSISEVLSEAVHLLNERDRIDQIKLESLHRDVGLGLQELAGGGKGSLLILKESSSEVKNVLMKPNR